MATVEEIQIFYEDTKKGTDNTLRATLEYLADNPNTDPFKLEVENLLPEETGESKAVICSVDDEYKYMQEKNTINPE